MSLGDITPGKTALGRITPVKRSAANLSAPSLSAPEAGTHDKKPQGGKPARSVTEAKGRSRGLFLAIGFFSIFINLLVLVVPLYMLQIYDRVLSSTSVETLWLLTVCAGALLLASVGLDAVRARLLVRLGTRLDLDLAEPIHARIFKKASSSGITSGQTQPLRDLDTVRNFLAGNGLITLFDAPWAPVFLAIIFLIHPLMGLVALAGAMILMILGVLGDYLTRDTLRQAQAGNHKALQLTEAGLQHIESARAMGLDTGLRARWQQYHLKALSLQGTASERAGSVSAWSRGIRSLTQVALLGTGALLVLQGAITPGVMIAASILMARALSPVESAIRQWRSYLLARAAGTRLDELFEEAEAADRVPTPLPAPKGELSVEKAIVTAPGGEAPIIKAISFSLEAGEVLGVFGPSGSGKSTLARVLVGFWSPANGHVRLDGSDLGDWDDTQLASHIGYLPQEVGLFEGTIRENIARFTEHDPNDVIAAAEKAGVHDLIVRLPGGYDAHVGEGGLVLSGGQRQRIGLARALFGEPALVVLDEPNANLDQEGEAALRSAVETLKAENKTVVMITHRASILAVADKVLVLKDGKIDKFGPRDQVIALGSKPLEAVPGSGASDADDGAAPAAAGRSAKKPRKQRKLKEAAQ